jgi:hypothetical protein
MDLHRLAEARSLAYHRAVAERLVAAPALLLRAERRVREWLATGDVHPDYAQAWERILRLPIADIAGAMTEDSEGARALRQSTPFAGFLPPRERWALWHDVRRASEAAAR